MGRVVKVLFFDEAGEPLGEFPSQQLPEDLFASRNIRGVQEPPFSLEQLVFLAESHPIHGAALEQRTTDVIGNGWEWTTDDDDAPDDERDELEAWFSGLAEGEETMQEILLAAWEGYETTGQGYVELARDAQGVIRRVYHVPSHTVRFHRDGLRLVQIRNQRTVWFKRWGIDDERYVDVRTGALRDDVPADKRANELLVLKQRSQRSTWYGVPKYVSAVGWITLALAIRDDNLMFFSNRREPRWAVIMENLDEDPNLEEDLRRAFAVDLKEPHRNLLIPITGDGKIKFEKLSSDRVDGSFEKLGDRADAAILVAHRVPPERLGIARVGPLGGNVMVASSRVYKEAVVGPSQAMLASRVNRLIEREFRPGVDAPLSWRWSPVELDLAEEAEDLRQGALAFKHQLIRLNEARVKAGWDPLPPDDPRGDMFLFELAPGAGGGGDGLLLTKEDDADPLAAIYAELRELREVG